MIKGTIEAKPQVFAAAVQWAAKFVAQRPATAAQGGIRLTVTGADLVVETYGEHIQAEAVVPVSGDGTGDIIVSARLLAELTKTFADKPVSISADGEDGMMLKVGRWEGTLPGIAEAWPADAVVVPEPIGTIDGTALATMIAQAGVATTDDDKKPVPYHCVHLEFCADKATAYAGDGHRTVRARAAFDLDAEAPEGASTSATTFGHVMVDAAASFIGPDRISVGLGPNLISLASPTRSVVIRQVAIDGGYNLGPVIDGFAGVQFPRAVEFAVADLLMPMKRANLMSGDKAAPIAIEVAEGKVWIHAKAADIKRKGAEDVDAEYVGPEHTMALNPTYLAAALSSAPGDRVQVAFNEAERSPGRPHHVVVTVPGDDTWHHILMPLKMWGA